MKALKIILILFFSLVCALYLAFLFVLPNIINVNQYKSLLSAEIKKSTGLIFNSDYIKLTTTPNLHVGIDAKNPQLAFPDGSDLISLSDLEIHVRILPLLFKKLEISKIQSNNLKINILMTKNDNIYLEEFLLGHLKKNDKLNFPFEFSDKLPKIVLNKYLITIKDVNTVQDFKIEGKNTRLDGRINKFIKIYTCGNLKIADKKAINYNINIDTFFPKLPEKEETDKKLFKFDIEPLLSIAKYDFTSDINVNLKISEKDDNLHIKGFLNAKNICFKVNDVKIPESWVNLSFNKNEIIAKSNLYVNKSDKINIDGDLKFGEKQEVNLLFNAQAINLRDIQNILIVICDISGLQNNLKEYTLKGTLNSDFQLKTNMKKIYSKGILNINDASIVHKSIPFKISDADCVLNFDNNKIAIHEASALVNGEKLYAVGSIDGEANADLKIYAKKLFFPGLYATFAPQNLKKSITVNKGIVGFDIFIKGRLDKIAPKIKAYIEDLELKEKTSNNLLAVKNADLNISVVDEDFKGDLIVKNALFNNKNSGISLSIPKIPINFTPDIIKILPTPIYFNSSKSLLSGEIKNYQKAPAYKIFLDGTIKSTDIRRFVPDNNRSLFVANGSIPYVADIAGEGKNINVELQAFSDAKNNISAVEILSLKEKNVLTDISLKIHDNQLKIDNVSLGKYGSASLSKNLKQNRMNYSKILEIKGDLTKITTKKPYIKYFKLHLFEPITASLRTSRNSHISVDGTLNVSGEIPHPDILGNLRFTNVSIPEYFVKADSVNAVINSGVIKLYTPKLYFGNFIASASMNIDTDFSKRFVISNLLVNSPYLDIDEIILLSSKFPQGDNVPGSFVPVNIMSGKCNVSKVKMNDIAVTDASSNLTLINNNLNLTNFKANAYRGYVYGVIKYNFPYLLTEIALKGSNLEANQTVTSLFALKDQIFGTLSFNANISFSGTTVRQRLQSLKGTMSFYVYDGQMGSLGKFEYFINAQNLLSANFIKNAVGTAIQAITPKNTGRFNYLKGNVAFSNGYMRLSPVLMSGPQMSLYLNGKLNLLDYYANIVILGKVTAEVVASLGPLGNVTIDGLLSNTPNLSKFLFNFVDIFNVIVPQSELSSIPPFSSGAKNGSPFRVIINGNIQKVTSVKSFKWVSSFQKFNEAKLKAKTFLNESSQNVINKMHIAPSSESTQSHSGGIQPVIQRKTEVEQVQQTIKQEVKPRSVDNESEASKQFFDLMQALPD